MQKVFEGWERIFIPKWPDTTVRELIDYLEDNSDQQNNDDDDDEPTHYLYGLCFVVHYYRGNDWALDLGKSYYTVTMARKTWNQLPVCLRDWLNTNLPRIHGSDLDENNVAVDDINITKVKLFRTSQERLSSGKSRLRYHLDRHGRLFTVTFPNTYKACIEESVGTMIGIESDKLKKWVKNVRHRKTAKLSTYEALKYLSNKYDFQYRIIDTLDDFTTDDIYHFIVDKQHLGHVVRVNKFKKQHARAESFKLSELPKVKDTINIAIDMEWEWLTKVNPNDASDRVYIAKDPIIVCVELRGHKVKESRQFVSGKLRALDQCIQWLDYVGHKYTEDYNVHCYSHNGKSIEHQLLIKEYLCTTPSLRPMSLTNTQGSKIKTFELFGIKFRDTSLYMAETLDKASDALLGVKKLELFPGLSKSDVHQKLLNDYKWSGSKEEVAYCAHDTHITLDLAYAINELLLEIFRNICIEEDCLDVYENNYKGRWLLALSSLPGIAQHFLANIYDLKTSPNSVDALLRETYFGGRNECMFIGKKVDNNLKAIDVNSMYPYQMTHLLPNRLLKAYYQPDVTLFEKLKSGSIDGTTTWIAIIDIIEYHKDIPIFPTRTAHHTIYPHGSFRCAMHDFQYYKEPDDDSVSHPRRMKFINELSGVEFKIHVLMVFDTVDISQCMLSCHQWRLDFGKDSAKGLMLKLFMNSAYGRFAMQPLRTVVHYVKPSEDEAFWTHHELSRLNWIEHEQCKLQTNLQIPAEIYFRYALCEPSEPNNNIAICSRITAGSGTQLALQMRSLRTQGAELLYCDTDSIYFNDISQCYPSSLDSKALGMWDYKEFTEIDIKTSKVYSTLDKSGSSRKLRYKGVHDPEDLEHEQTCESWTRLLLTPMIYTVHKTSSFAYVKGVLDVETGYVRPIVLT